LSTAAGLELADTVAVAAGISGGSSAADSGKSLVGVLGVLGGAACHLALGTTYCWGNFLPYLPPHLRFFDGLSHPGVQPDALWVLPGAFIFQMLTMPFGPWFQARIGCRMTTLLGCWLMSLGVFLAASAPNLTVFMLCYSALFGAGVGIAYTAPMVNGWRWFPKRRGLVSGAVVAGFGAGGFIFNQVGSKLANPTSINSVAGSYPPAIYAAFPVMLRKLALFYAVLTGFGAFLVRPPSAAAGAGPAGKGGKPAAIAVAAGGKGYTVREALKSPTFYLLWAMALGIGISGINTANVYKAYGSTIESLRQVAASDSFQALVGSLGALFNGGGRLFWGNVLDAVGFRRPFALLAALQAAAMALYPVVARTKVGFAAATCTILFCLGGNFAMFPAVSTRIFGADNGAAIYGCLFSAFATASIGGTFLTKALQARFGWAGVFRVMSALSVVVLAVLGTLGGGLP
ncbi:unnamed protein product, partial [Phaeothamnion confervicola]